jgi:hypothetical protein
MEETAVWKKLFFSFFIFLDLKELASVCQTLFLSLSLKITGPYYRGVEIIGDSRTYYKLTLDKT